MIDMGAILGGRAIVGKIANVGKNELFLVLSNQLVQHSPVSVIICINGANAVVIEGVFKSVAVLVVAAGAIVTKMLQKTLW